ncbi:uncharacterized protein LOC112556769 [Pomacea canaliculata]|nr:uncharacterized protein LOC112556769 [Pomacea canaliculata]XP_025081904.1 uncharacterized protein LOC112556769 [Pomacea canaliculata]XP_025081905.1 uncharacterized protein LOC112556769 [Pomacea canaliculata]XP_025081907.1 uncharacterized protein LOC112556769 [Pomacea canaliculata]
MAFMWFFPSFCILSVIFSGLFNCPRAMEELDMHKLQDALNIRAPLLVLLYSDSCQACQEAEDLLNTMTSQGEISQLIPDIQVMKEKTNGAVASLLKSQVSPTFVLIRDGEIAVYTDKLDDSEQIFSWLGKAGSTSLTRFLTDDTFEHLTQASTGSTTGHWLVLFYRQSCPDYFHILESIGVNEKSWINVAKVDVDANPKLALRFKITTCPELIYFRDGKMYRYETQKYDLPSVTSFVKSWYRNVKASPVPVESTAFDALTENIALYIKSQLQGENRTLILAVAGGLTFTFVIVIIFCCITGGSDSKMKKD